MTNEQQQTIQELTDPSRYGGAVSHTINTVLSINGCHIIIYPNGRIDILAVSDGDYAAAAENVIRDYAAGNRDGKKMLNHTRIYREHADLDLRQAARAYLRAVDGPSGDEEHAAAMNMVNIIGV